ncbi:MAG: nucleotidyl transferase AbiEii/AbiGii toxin family protein [Deltaproteobacteria bacterium]|nr:nucleotidyl transferase AbiEii/AbiGii toxin family protein [Deltaproteobacteria bacterium]
MSIPFPDTITADALFVWLIHRISEVFEDHAILKGGMELRLLDCPRSTNDLDYVFVPYNSKNEIVEGLVKIMNEIPGAKINKTMNSKALKIVINVAHISLQVEANVLKECKAVAMSTNSLANKVNQLGKIIRIMSLDVALSHKLSAWNERRLMRDLYDIYYIFQIVGAKPDLDTLLARLNKIESRIPRFKKVKKMSLNDFVNELSKEQGNISAQSVKKELSPLLDEVELAGLESKLKATINKLVEFLEGLCVGLKE